MQSFFPQAANTIVVKKTGKSGFINLDFLETVKAEANKCNGPGIILYQDIRFSDGDITLPIVALGNKRLMYTFGKNFGTVSITGTIYNATGKDSVKLDSLSKVYEEFMKARVSEGLVAVNLSLSSGFKCKVFITSFSLAGANPNNQSISFTLEGTVCPPSNKG